MKALSIRQPWAWAILHAGKDVENRDWQERNPGRRFRGRFLIHASGGMTRAEYEDFLSFAHHVSLARPLPLLALPSFQSLLRGGIVGSATIDDLVTESDSPWFCGPVALRLSNVMATPFVPCKGALGFFDVPNAIAAKALYEAAPVGD